MSNSVRKKELNKLTSPSSLARRLKETGTETPRVRDIKETTPMSPRAKGFHEGRFGKVSLDLVRLSPRLEYLTSPRQKIRRSFVSPREDSPSAKELNELLHNFHKGKGEDKKEKRFGEDKSGIIGGRGISPRPEVAKGFGGEVLSILAKKKSRVSATSSYASSAEARSSSGFHTPRGSKFSNVTGSSTSGSGSSASSRGSEQKEKVGINLEDVKEDIILKDCQGVTVGNVYPGVTLTLRGRVEKVEILGDILGSVDMAEVKGLRELKILGYVRGGNLFGARGVFLRLEKLELGIARRGIKFDAFQSLRELKIKELISNMEVPRLVTAFEVESVAADIRFKKGQRFQWIKIGYVHGGHCVALPNSMKVEYKGRLERVYWGHNSGIKELKIGTVPGHTKVVLPWGLQEFAVDSVEGVIDFNRARGLKKLKIGKIEAGAKVVVPESVEVLEVGKVEGELDLSKAKGLPKDWNNVLKLGENGAVLTLLVSL